MTSATRNGLGAALVAVLLLLGLALARADGRPLPENETTDDARLWLARAMVAEAGWKAERDHAAIAWVLARRWKQENRRYPHLTFKRMVQLYCAGFGTQKPTARQRWVRSLDATTRRPEGFPTHLSWDRHSRRWQDVYERAGDFFDGRVEDPCRGRAMQWGGTMDVAPRHWVVVQCGPTANRFYAIGESSI